MIPFTRKETIPPPSIGLVVWQDVQYLGVEAGFVALFIVFNITLQRMELMTCRPKMRYAPTKSNFLLLAFANFEAGVFPLDGHFQMTEAGAKEFFSYPNGEFFKGVVSQDSTLMIWPSGYAISADELYAKSLKEGVDPDWEMEFQKPRSLV